MRVISEGSPPFAPCCNVRDSRDVLLAETMRKGSTVVVSCRCRGMNSQLSERDSWTVSLQVPPLGSQLSALMCFCQREKPSCYLVTTTPLHCGTSLLYFINYLSGSVYWNWSFIMICLHPVSSQAYSLNIIYQRKRYQNRV